MKKILLTTLFLSFFALNLNAQSANIFCGGDESEYSDMVNCYVNQIDDCRDAHTTCQFDQFTMTPGDVISNLINRCCRQADDDSQDACFLADVRRIRRVKGLSKKYRRDISKRIRAYINNPDVQCNEA